MSDILHLKNAVFQRAVQKFSTFDDSIIDKLNYELSVIEQLNLSYYFLNFIAIIDICNHKGWLRSPGRGTSTSSLVNYCLDITKINPIEYGLYFERFINPDHFVGIDIDIDIPTGKRSLLIELLAAELMESKIHQYVFPPSKYNDEEVKYAHNGKEFVKHPFGILISDLTQLTDLETLEIENSKFCVLSDYKNSLRQISPYKYDIIENDYLAILQQICSHLDGSDQLYKISTKDKATFKLLNTGQTDNIFLFSDEELKLILKAFQPSTILEMAIINALYRPGLVDKIPKMIHNKKFGYDQPFSSDIRVSRLLSETYGLLVFQESFLDIVIQIAGFKATEADYYLRVLCGRKNFLEINNFKQLFLAGCECYCTLTSVETQLLLQLLLIEGPFTFQKSHAISYSTISYWCAYYKTHFRKEFENYIAFR
jgi:DNA polymerase III subunit alpha